MNGFFTSYADRIKRTRGCWIWTGAKDACGYGLVFTSRRLGPRKQLRVHRLAYEAAMGCEIPAGKIVRHKCDNPACVRPAHLESGTQADNIRDMIDRRRNIDIPCKGEENTKAKLTADDVIEIRRAYFPNGSGKRGNAGILARRYGVTVATIQRAAKGRQWQHLRGG